MLWARRRRRRRLGQSYVDFAAPVNAPPTGSICLAILRCSIAGLLGVALLRLRARLPRASSRSQLDPVPCDAALIRFAIRGVGAVSSGQRRLQDVVAPAAVCISI